MTKQEIITKLEELLVEPMDEKKASTGKDVLATYQTQLALDHKAQLEKFLADGGEKSDFVAKKDEEDEKFSALWTKFTQEKTAFEKAAQEAEKVNKSKKEEIISEIEGLVNEENIKQAMTRIKELEEAWKNIGATASDVEHDLHQNYGRARDAFFYNMRIYRELLEHDLKRNLQLKEELAIKMEEALSIDKIKELEAITRAFSKEWDDIGPTFHDKWEGVRDRFKDAQRKAYDKIRTHYKGIKEQMQENLQKKEGLCERIEEMASQEITSEKRWKKLTNDVIAIQKEWKSTGFVPKQANEEIWKRFKTAGDEFFNKKKTFYASLKSEQDKHRETKRELVKRAEELKESELWKETTEELINLQKKWKKAGKAHQRDEQRLWKQFRAACNHFFEKKKAFFDTKDERQDNNLKAKHELIKELEAIKPQTDDNATIKAIDELVSKFGSIGFVPINDKNKVNNLFSNALTKKYKEIGLENEAIDKLLYVAKIKELGEAKTKVDSKAIEREERQLRDKIGKLKATIIQYENNLGFFANSKGANKLKEEVESKIEHSKEQIERVKDQLKLLKQTKDDNFKNPFVVEKSEEKKSEDIADQEDKSAEEESA